MRMIIVALSNIRSLFNVGSIFRTADAFGIDSLILGGYTGYPPRKEITKTALGAERWVPWERVYHIPRKLRALKEEGFTIIGLENNISPQTIPLQQFIPPRLTVLVLGNEVRGLSPAVQKEIDTFVAIPMVGKKESLNVAVAFGIAAWHVTMKQTYSMVQMGGEHI